LPGCIAYNLLLFARQHSIPSAIISKSPLALKLDVGAAVGAGVGCEVGASVTPHESLRT
jgi:hypothetical protein